MDGPPPEDQSRNALQDIALTVDGDLVPRIRRDPKIGNEAPIGMRPRLTSEGEGAVAQIEARRSHLWGLSFPQFTQLRPQAV